MSLRYYGKPPAFNDEECHEDGSDESELEEEPVEEEDPGKMYPRIILALESVIDGPYSTKMFPTCIVLYEGYHDRAFPLKDITHLELEPGQAWRAAIKSNPANKQKSDFCQELESFLKRAQSNGHRFVKVGIRMGSQEPFLFEYDKKKMPTELEEWPDEDFLLIMGHTVLYSDSNKSVHSDIAHLTIQSPVARANRDLMFP